MSDTADRFGENLPIVESATTRAQKVSGVQISVFSVNSIDVEPCQFGRSTAAEWGRDAGAYLVIVLFGSADSGSVCLNKAARTKLAQLSADLPASLDVFHQLCAQQRWASAVIHFLKGVLPGNAAVIGYPDRHIEAAQPDIVDRGRSDNVVAYVLTIVLPAVVLAGMALVAWFRRDRTPVRAASERLELRGLMSP